MIVRDHCGKEAAMGQPSDSTMSKLRSATPSATSDGVTALGPERRKSARRVSLEQEKADFAAWLREYRRWTQGGCSPGARSGEIEWGGEERLGH
jgi:hypothetical protein